MTSDFVMRGMNDMSALYNHLFIQIAPPDFWQGERFSGKFMQLRIGVKIYTRTPDIYRAGQILVQL